MKNCVTRLTTISTLFALSLLATQSSNAITTLSIFDGSTTLTVVDDDPNDSTPGAGIVTWNGSIGVWDVNVASGFTQPSLGTTTDPRMSLSGVNHSVGAGVLTITFTDTDFAALPVFAISEIGGTQDGSNPTINYITLQGGSQIANTGLIFGTPFSASILGYFAVGTNPPPPGQISTYSLSQVITITHTDAGNTSFGASLTAPVPEPTTTLFLMGIGLGTAHVVRAKRKTSRANSK